MNFLIAFDENIHHRMHSSMRSNADVFSNESLCLLQLHCNEIGIAKRDYGDYWFSKWRLGFGFILSLVFLLVAGVAPCVTIDNEEAMTEETTANCMLDPENPPIKLTMWSGLQLMHFLLCKTFCFTLFCVFIRCYLSDKHDIEHASDHFSTRNR